MSSRRSWPFLLATAVSAAAPQKPNVLFIVVDDLRTQLNCYGESYIKSPSIDGLASEGTLFKRAYAQIPVCGASRCSFLSGIRPTSATFNLAKEELRDYYPNSTTLPKAFRDAGYHTIGNGKIFHVASDMPNSWDESPAGSEGASLHERSAFAGGRGPFYESPDVPDDKLADGMLADKVISDLKRMKGHPKPFFIAAGFHKPHLPLIAPKRYFDLYRRSEIPLAPNRSRPRDAPPEAGHESGEIKLYDLAGLAYNSEEFHRAARHAYSACVSYVDAQIGRVLRELETLGMKDNTLVVLMGDHGWRLGEQNAWGKHTLFHDAIQSPLIVSGPGVPGNATRNQLVEFVDVFPSLLEMAGIPPTPALKAQLQGTSFAPMLKDANAPWKTAAFSKWLRDGDGNTLVTERYAYTEFGAGGKGHRMLFDLETDPGQTVNISEHAGRAALVEDLSRTLRAGWKNVPVGIGAVSPAGPSLRMAPKGEMRIFSPSGALIRTLGPEERRRALTSGNLDLPQANGTYFYSLRGASGLPFRGRLVVQDGRIIR